MATKKHDPTVRPPDCKGISKETGAICTLINTGMEPEEAYKIVKKRELTKGNKHELKRKANAMALQDPIRVQKAQRALDKILAGKKVGDAKSINTSDILAAVKMVADRVDPVISQSMNISATVEISPVDLSKYLNVDGGDEDG